MSEGNDYWKKVYEQAEPKAVKYLHSNGTIDENPGSGSSVSLEDNKEVTITENGEIEITPSTGKDGMKKVTATVNVSGGGSNTLYAWGSYGSEVFTITATPTTANKAIYADNYMVIKDITEVGEDTITVEDRGTLTRYPDGDIQL